MRIAIIVVLALAPAIGSADTKPSCSAHTAADLTAKAISNMNMGADAAALFRFEKSYACKRDASLLPVMVLVACLSQNPKKARQWYAKCGVGPCTTVAGRCKQLKIPLP